MEITDFFTAESLNADGGITMLDHAVEDRKMLYLTNANGQKLLNRRTARPNSDSDGTLAWSTMARDEERLRAS